MEERLIIWDAAKNEENKLKHKIGFEVAQYVFSDPLWIWRPDRSENNKSDETRWQTIGKVGRFFFFGLHRTGRKKFNHYAPYISARSRKT